MKKSTRMLGILLALLLAFTPVFAYAAEEIPDGARPADSVSALDYIADPAGEEAEEPLEGESLDPVEETVTEDAQLDGENGNGGSTTAERRYVFIGDSYLAGSGANGPAYGKLFKERLDLSDEQYYENAVPGSGFIRNKTFIVQLNDTAGTMTDEQRESITDLFVLGGWNDQTYETNKIVPAVEAFMDNAAALFPNATIHIGMLSYHLLPGRRAVLERMKDAYYSVVGSHTIVVAGTEAGTTEERTYEVNRIPGIEYILAAHADDCMTSDKLHPSNAGHGYLADALVRYIQTGDTGGEQPVYAESLTISAQSLSMKEGEEQRLTARIAPENAGIKTVRWSSSDSNVATVNDNGVVSAMNAGTAVITAEAADASGKSASCTVNVTDSGLINGPLGWGFYRNGTFNTSKTGVYKNEHGWWYVERGRVTFNYNGVARNQNGLWFIRNSKVDFNVHGVVKAGDGNWYLFSGGKVQETNTVAQNANGWWCIENGRVTFKYNGVARNQNGAWFIRNSKVDFNVHGVVKAGDGNWYRFSGGKVIPGPDVRNNANGWWYIDQNGKVDFTYNGLAKNENGWWYCQNGKVTFSYNGVARNGSGLWFIRNSKVDFNVNGVVKAGDGNWYYFVGGKVQEGYTGVQRNVNGLWYIKNGRVDFTVNGRLQVNGTWYTFNGGKVVEQSANARYIMIGDSRTIDLFANSDAQIKGAAHDGITVYAVHGEGFEYMQNTLNGINTSTYDVLVSWMGANDEGDFSRYAACYEGLLRQGKGIILCTVGPTTDSRLSAADIGYGFQNKNIVNYNTQLKEWASKNHVKVVDVYTYIGANPNAVRTDSDGIHYSPKPNKTLWNYIVTQVKN